MPEGHGLSSRNLTDHVRRGHVSILSEAVLGAQRSRSEEKDEIVESATAAVDRAVRLSNVIVGEVLRGIVEGELQPDIGHGLKAAAFLGRLHDDGATPYAALWQLVVVRMLDLTETLADSETFQKLVNALRTDEELLALDAELRHQSGRGLASVTI